MTVNLLKSQPLVPETFKIIAVERILNFRENYDAEVGVIGEWVIFD